MFLKRSKDQILTDAFESIVENTPITNAYAGGIARSIVEAVSGEFENLYEVAEYILNQSYVSRADEEHLPLIGELFNYPRRSEIVVNQDTGEHEEQLIDLETYRYEISKQVHAAVSSNEESVRLHALQVSGVQEIEGREFSHGSGSFNLVVTVLSGFNEEYVRDQVEEIVEKTKAFGVKSIITLPQNISLELKLQLILKDSSKAEGSLKHKVEANLFNYFGGFRTGQEFIYNEFVQKVMESDEEIADFKVLEFFLDQRPAMLTNQPVLPEERVRPVRISIV